MVATSLIKKVPWQRVYCLNKCLYSTDVCHFSEKVWFMCPNVVFVGNVLTLDLVCHEIFYTFNNSGPLLILFSISRGTKRYYLLGRLATKKGLTLITMHSICILHRVHWACSVFEVGWSSVRSLMYDKMLIFCHQCKYLFLNSSHTSLRIPFHNWRLVSLR